MYDSYIYLAAPYTDTDLATRQSRVACATRVAVALMLKGYKIFSPLTHTYPMEELLPDKSHTFWMHQDIPLLHNASALWVLCLPGWEHSRGVAEEVQYALRMGKPVTYLDKNGEVIQEQSNTEEGKAMTEAKIGNPINIYALAKESGALEVFGGYVFDSVELITFVSKILQSQEEQKRA